MFIPNQKTKRIKLKRNCKAWAELVRIVFERDNYSCQICYKNLPKSFLAPHHIKTVGSGGNDILENLITLCAICHEGVHKGNIKI